MGATSKGDNEEEVVARQEFAQSESIPDKPDLTVCDIIGDWGHYQWSLTLFALIYSALASVFVVVGPIWTPDINHVCRSPNYNTTINEMRDVFRKSATNIDRRECFIQQQHITDSETDSTSPKQPKVVDWDECSQFVYDDENYGKVLTNTFDLVCSRKWLRSFVSSSSLLAIQGMLISSVTLGVLSDRYGRINCLKIGFAISMLSTIGAMLANNYFLFNLCIMLMSFSQMGCANANCTLVMESTSPKWRFIPVFQFGFGWGIGVLIVPILNKLTKNYQHFLLISLVWQIVMAIWLRFGVFESIRWLLSEGQINRAQIELQRACRINRVKNGAGLAQKIAQVQVQQVRKASLIIAEKTAPINLADYDQVESEGIASRELNLLGEAIRRSFGLPKSNHNNKQENTTILNSDSDEQTTVNSNLPLVLSPTLARKSFSVAQENIPAQLQVQQQQLDQQSIEMSILDRMAPQARQSITTQCLIQLALKYGKNLQKQDEGSFFLTKMFHRKLYKATIMLMMESVMLEMAYYGLLQTNSFVGPDINLNYMAGAFSEWIAAGTYLVILYIFSRKIALILPTIVSAIICCGIALSYHLIPNSGISSINFLSNGNLIESEERVIGEIIASNRNGSLFDTHLGKLSSGEPSQTEEELMRLRESINFWLTTIGKLTVTVSIQVAATISMEYYPNNLRQTACGAIVFVGRAGSVLAPFLFNDLSEEKTVFKITLVSISMFGFIVCFMVPFLLRDTKDQELCDSMNEIKDDDDDDGKR